MKKQVIFGVFFVLLTAILFAQTKKKPVAQAKKASPNQASIQRGEQVYKITCIACHQPNGLGVPRLNPPLSKTSYVLGDKTRLIRIVIKGLNETIEIDGEEYTNAMPGFAQLNDQQVADVLTYVRNSFGNKATAVTPAQVKAVRAKLK